MLCLPVVTMAQQTYTFTAYRNIVPNGYNFWLSVPDDYEQKKSEMPVVIFLAYKRDADSWEYSSIV